MRIVAGVLVIGLLIGSTGFAADEAKPAESAKIEPKIEKAVDPEAVVVKINDKVIKEKDVAAETEKRLAAQAKRMPPGMEINDWMRNQVRTSVVDMMVEQILVEQKLASLKMSVTDEQVMKEIEDIAKNQNIKTEDIPAEIAKYGMTMDDLKQQVRMKVQVDTLINSQLKDKDVTDEEVKKFYDDNPQYFERPEQVRAAHVLIKTEGMTDEQKAEAKKKAEGVLKRAKAGEDFAALAKEFSEDPGSKDNGGEYTFPKGQMVKPFEDAAFGLKDNAVSDLVETQFGFHIIKTYEHIAAQKQPFDDVKDQIKQHLERQKRGQFWEEYSKKMKEEAKIEFSESEQKMREASARPPMPPMMTPQPAPQPKPEAAEK